MTTPINSNARINAMGGTDTPRPAPASLDDAFDVAMRERHRQAADAVSPRVALQLQVRRRAALADKASLRTATRRSRWGVRAVAGASFAALIAVAMGIGLPRDAVVPTGQSTMAATSAANDDLDTILDENPDFYVWLASSDANTLAME